MSTNARNKKDMKKLLVRIVSLGLAALMVLSVLFTAVWQ